MSSSKEADDVNDVINAKMTSLRMQCPTVTFGIYLNTATRETQKFVKIFVY